MIWAFSSIAHPLESIIITKGQGGDFYAAKVLHNSLKNSTLMNVGYLNFRNLKDKKCVVIFGQGAADTIVSSDQFSSLLNTHSIALYTHLLDNQMVYFLKKRIEGGAHMNLFVTDSQLLKLKRNDFSLYEKLIGQSSNVQLYTSPTAAPSVQFPKTIQYTQSPKLDNAIWLGGNYTNSQGVREIFNTAHFIKALGRVKVNIHPGSSVGLFLMPRVFDSSMTERQRSQRVQAMVDLFENNKVIVFANKELLAQFSVNAITEDALSYSELMMSDWGDTIHYASADQYNIFSDLKEHRLTPFLLNPNDEDQKLYAESYLRAKSSKNKSSTILELIALHQCNN